MLTIYHNPRCSKSRQTLALINDSSQGVAVVEYLQNPPTADELKDILQKLDLRPLDIIRKNETVFKEKYKGQDYSDQEWIDIMVKNPILIERPIVVKGKQAIIGRPPTNVKTLL